MRRLGAVLATILLSACGDGSAVPAGKSVNSADFARAGLKWPLTVEQGSIGCDGMSYWFKTNDGTAYALNGMATQSGGYQPIEPIWAEDEKMMTELRNAGVADGTTLRINIGDMIQEAFKLCS